jgi:hypothetical protein
MLVVGLQLSSAANVLGFRRMEALHMPRATLEHYLSPLSQDNHNGNRMVGASDNEDQFWSPSATPVMQSSAAIFCCLRKHHCLGASVRFAYSISYPPQGALSSLHHT